MIDRIDQGRDEGLFLDHLEKWRGNSVSSRNVRLSAIRSFFRLVALRDPDSISLATRVLAIPVKRQDKKLIGYLTRTEIQALLAAPDRSQWPGQRDHALFLTLYNSGARVCEITALTRDHVCFGVTNFLQLTGKGRKERTVPLWTETSKILKAWLRKLGHNADGIAFPNARGKPLSRDGVDYVLIQAVRKAIINCPSLATKTITPHIMRHYVYSRTMSSWLQKQRLRRRPTRHLRDIVRGCCGGPGVESRTDLVEARDRKRYASGIRRSYPSFSVSSSVPNRRSGDLRTMSSGRVTRLRASI